MITSIRYLELLEHEIQINLQVVYYCLTVKANKPTPTHYTVEDKFQIYRHFCVYIVVLCTVALKHMNYMFRSSEVYFHRQHTLNLTNTNLGRRGKNNNPFQRDSYLQNINIILCIVIKARVYFHPRERTSLSGVSMSFPKSQVDVYMIFLQSLFFPSYWLCPVNIAVSSYDLDKLFGYVWTVIFT